MERSILMPARSAKRFAPQSANPPLLAQTIASSRVRHKKAGCAPGASVSNEASLSIWPAVVTDACSVQSYVLHSLHKAPPSTVCWVKSLCGLTKLIPRFQLLVDEGCWRISGFAVVSGLRHVPAIKSAEVRRGHKEGLPRTKPSSNTQAAFAFRQLWALERQKKLPKCANAIKHEQRH